MCFMPNLIKLPTLQIFRAALIFAMTALLIGCATQEFRSARNECSADAYRQYPINNVATIVSTTRAVQVPSGRTECTTTYVGFTARTTCENIMQTVYQQVPQNVIVDTNESSRQYAMNSCAQQICYRRYGNAECKTK